MDLDDIEDAIQPRPFPSIEGVNVFKRRDFEESVYRMIPAVYGEAPLVTALFVPSAAMRLGMVNGGGSLDIYKPFHRVLGTLRANVARADPSVVAFMSITIPAERNMNSQKIAGMFFIMYERRIPTDSGKAAAIVPVFGASHEQDAAVIESAARSLLVCLNAAMGAAFPRASAAEKHHADMKRRYALCSEEFAKRERGLSEEAQEERAVQECKNVLRTLVNEGIEQENDPEVEKSLRALMKRGENLRRFLDAMEPVDRNAETIRETVAAIEKYATTPDLKLGFIRQCSRVLTSLARQLNELALPPVGRLTTGMRREAVASFRELEAVANRMAAAHAEIGRAYDDSIANVLPVPIVIPDAPTLNTNKAVGNRYRALLKDPERMPSNEYFPRVAWKGENNVKASVTNSLPTDWTPVLAGGLYVFSQNVRSVLFLQHHLAKSAEQNNPDAANSSSQEARGEAGALPGVLYEPKQYGDFSSFCESNLTIELAYRTYVAYATGSPQDPRDAYIFPFEEIFTEVDIRCGSLTDNICEYLGAAMLKAGKGDNGPPALRMYEPQIRSVTVPSVTFSGCTTVLTREDVKPKYWMNFSVPMPSVATDDISARYAAYISSSVSNVSGEAPGLVQHATDVVMNMIGASDAMGNSRHAFVQYLENACEGFSGKEFTANSRAARDAVLVGMEQLLTVGRMSLPAGVAAHAKNCATIHSRAIAHDAAARDGIVVGTADLVASHRIRALEAMEETSSSLPRRTAVSRVRSAFNNEFDERDVRVEPVQLREHAFVQALARPHMATLHAVRAHLVAGSAHEDDTLARRVANENDLEFLRSFSLHVAVRDDLPEGVTTQLVAGDVVVLSNDGPGVVLRNGRCRSPNEDDSPYRTTPFALALETLAALYGYGHAAPQRYFTYSPVVAGIVGVTALNSRDGELRPSILLYGGGGTGKTFEISAAKRLVPKGSSSAPITTSAKGDQVASDLLRARFLDEGGAYLGLGKNVAEIFNKYLKDANVSDTAETDAERISRMQQGGSSAEALRAVSVNGRIRQDRRDLGPPGMVLGAINLHSSSAISMPTRSRQNLIYTTCLRGQIAFSRARGAGGNSYHAPNRGNSLTYVQDTIADIHAFSFRYGLAERMGVVPPTCTAIHEPVVTGAFQWLGAYGLRVANPREVNVVETFSKSAMTARVVATLRRLGVYAPTRPVTFDAASAFSKLAVITLEDTCSGMASVHLGGEPFHRRMLEIIYEMTVARLEMIAIEAESSNRAIATRNFPMFNPGSSVPIGRAPMQASSGAPHAPRAEESNIPSNMDALVKLIEAARSARAITPSGHIQLTTFVQSTSHSANPAMGGNVMDPSSAIASERSSGGSYANVENTRLSTLTAFRDILCHHPIVVDSGLYANNAWAFIGWCLVTRNLPGDSIDSEPEPILMYDNAQIFVNLRVLVAVLASTWHIAVSSTLGDDIRTNVGVYTGSGLDTFAVGNKRALSSPALAIAPLRAMHPGFRSIVTGLMKAITGKEAKADDEEEVRLLKNTDVETAHLNHIMRCFDDDEQLARRSFAFSPNLHRLAASVRKLRSAVASANGASVIVALADHVIELAKTSDGYTHYWSERDVALFLAQNGCTCGLTVKSTAAAASPSDVRSSSQPTIHVSGTSALFVRLAHIVLHTSLRRVLRSSPAPEVGRAVDHCTTTVRTAMSQYETLCAASPGVFLSPQPVAATASLFDRSPNKTVLDAELTEIILVACRPAHVAHDHFAAVPVVVPASPLSDGCASDASPQHPSASSQASPRVRSRIDFSNIEVHSEDESSSDEEDAVDFDELSDFSRKRAADRLVAPRRRQGNPEEEESEGDNLTCDEVTEEPPPKSPRLE